MVARGPFDDAWVFVGRVEDFPSPGAWLRVPLTPAGVLVVRGDDAELRAFHAICPHRGTAFLDRDEGCAERFRCPYHGFEFGRDGRAHANTDDLAPVRIAVEAGFVFVTLGDAPFSFGDAPPWLARADLARLRRVRRLAYDVAASLRLVVENFQESLQSAGVHPALEAITPSRLAETWTPEAGGPWLSSLQRDSLLTFAVFPLARDRTHVVACTYVHEDASDDAIEDVTAFWSRVYEEDRIAVERKQIGVSSLGARLPAYTDVEEGAAAFAALLRKKDGRGRVAPCGRSY